MDSLPLRLFEGIEKGLILSRAMCSYIYQGAVLAYQNIVMSWSENWVVHSKKVNPYIILTELGTITILTISNFGLGQYVSAKEPPTLPVPIAYSHISLQPLKELPQSKFEPEVPVEPLWVDKRRPIGTYANDYAPGNCTWYVASRLPVPNSMGNANNWAYSASMAGLQVGSTPKVGSIAQTGGDSWLGHVAIVESVNPDGSFVVSEMNYGGLGVVDTRLTNTGEFGSFIYV